MPDAYVVTTPTTTVTLAAPTSPSARRTGQVAFTVTNIAGRPLRTRLRLVPQEPVTVEWLTIQGARERTLGLGATDNYTVAVEAPPEVPEGTYTFRADAVGEDSPDEDFATGPTVSLVVPPTRREGRSLRWWWVAVAAVLVLAAGVGLFLLLRNSGRHDGTATATPAATAPLTGSLVVTAQKNGAPVVAADNATLELSSDNGTTWGAAQQVTENPFTFPGLAPGAYAARLTIGATSQTSTGIQVSSQASAATTLNVDTVGSLVVTVDVPALPPGISIVASVVVLNSCSDATPVASAPTGVSPRQATFTNLAPGRYFVVATYQISILGIQRTASSSCNANADVTVVAGPTAATKTVTING